MVHNLPPDDIYHAIVNDFIGAWNSIAANSDKTIGRGNFMFAHQAMVLLEFAARLCHKDTEIHKRFSRDLCNIEPKYFTSLPSPFAGNDEFVLPYTDDSDKDRTLLWALFDLVRNGLAHQYQQIVVRLMDQKRFFISITGPDTNGYLNVSVDSRPLRHLAYIFDSDGDLGLRLLPDILFLDIKKAVETSALLSNTNPESFDYLSRPRHYKQRTKRPNQETKSRHYEFDISSLEEHLRKGGHKRL
jgi:hypothetical protein